VYENLLYSARIRLPTSMSSQQQQAIVEDVMDILDLTRLRDVVVGGTEKRGISGGQKKRVNIGMELVAYPRVLFLDEPTSGLDSAASLQVSRCLQRMRALGITVVTVIHQPRFSVFRCFSHCILFAKGGKLVYLGPTSAIQKYFEDLGFTLPSGENVADWFIDIVSGQCVRKLPDGSIDKDFVPENDLPKLWIEHKHEVELSRENSALVSVDGDIENSIALLLGNCPPDEALTEKDLIRLFALADIADVEKTDIANLYAQLRDSLPRGTPLTPRSLAGVIVKNQKAHDGETRGHAVSVGESVIQNRPPVGFFSQLGSFIYRCLAKFDVKMLLLRCIISAVGAVIVALAFKGDLNYSLLPTIGQSGLILFCIISAASFLYVFGDERIVFTRESKTGFSICAYWLAKNIVNVIDIFLITLFYYSFFFAITLPDYMFVQGAGVFLLMAWFTSGIAHFFSVALSPAAALLISVLLPSLYTSMFGGVKPVYDDMTTAQRVVAYTGSGYYGIESLTVYELKALPEYTLNIEPVVSILTTYSYDLNCITENSLIMLAIGAVWRIFTLIALYSKVYGFPGSLWRHWRHKCNEGKQNAAAAATTTNDSV
jgi:ABC-type multidrug transport system ATPase subunit